MSNLLNRLFQPAATALVSLACLTLAEATAQTNTRVRVSIKRVLGPSGTANSFWTDSTIERWMRDSNQVFNRDLGIQLMLSEVVDMPDPGSLTGGPSWWAVSPSSSYLSNLEGLAKADPTFYGWRRNAINIYLVNSIVGAGGVCSFPDGSHNEIIFVQPNILNGSIGFCHELGHYFDLMHTHEIAYGAESVGTCQYPSPNGSSSGDLVSDTPGDPYRMLSGGASLASRVALLNSIYGSGSCFGANSTPFRRLRYNVMSYYGGISTSDALFTPGQRTRAQAALTNDRQHVVMPMVDPNYPLAISGHAGAQGIPHLQLSPPRLGSYLQIGVERAPSLATTYLVLGLTRVDLPMPLGATLNPSPDLVIPKVTDSNGATSAPFYLPNMPGLIGVPLYMQSLSLDPVTSGAVVMSDTRRGELFQRKESDFNGDGYTDLAVGVPFEDVGEVMNAGAVNIVYGGSSGLGGVSGQLWYQGHAGLAGAPEEHDLFGNNLAHGDFNNDGFSDLAISVHAEDLSAASNTGAVHVLYGSAAGLTASGSQLWHQGSFGINMSSENDDQFGSAVAAGDINGDGFADLAIGVRGEDAGAASDGAVLVLFGSAAGLTSAGSEVWHQDVPGVEGAGETADWMGTSLHIDDFDRDGYADLVVGVTAEDIGSIANAGMVLIFRGSPNGVTLAGHQALHQDSPGVIGVAEPQDFFGQVLESGDFNADGYPDLVVGIPEENDNAGVVQFFPGSASGLVGADSEIWRQNSVGVYGASEANDRFGAALAVGDFDGDGYEDLAVGADSEDVGSFSRCGMVNILQGGPCGLSGGIGRWWAPGFNGPGFAHDDAFFGGALAAGDANGDGCADLFVGVSGTDLWTSGQQVNRVGAVRVLLGQYQTPGLHESGTQWLLQGSPGVSGAPETLDGFGGGFAR